MSITLRPERAGKRMDVFVAEETGLSRSQAQKLIEEGRALVGGSAVKSNYLVRAGDEIKITLPSKHPMDALMPEDIPVEILYRDEHIVVLNKPSDIVVYPAAGHERGTLMNGIAFHVGVPSAPGGPLRPGIVHRLDKDTSGVMVIALTDKAYYGLIEQFRERKVAKRYTALVWGRPKAEKGEIIAAIGRSRTDRKKMTTKTNRGKQARTVWEVLELLKDAALVGIRLETGRTHQIRVHFASEGHPVLGDRVYGKKTKLGHVHFPRQMLHASRLGFIHPVTGQYMEFESPLPEDMKKAIVELRDA